MKSVQFIYASALKYIGGTKSFTCLAHLTTENLGGEDSKHPQEYLRMLKKDSVFTDHKESRNVVLQVLSEKPHIAECRKLNLPVPQR